MRPFCGILTLVLCSLSSSAVAVAVPISLELPAGGGEASAAAPVGILAGDGAFLLVWESRDGAEADVLFNRREPGASGAWLEQPRRLDTDGPGAARSLEPRLVAGPRGLVFAVWQDSRSGKDDIRFNRSSDGGLTWLEADVRLNTDGAGASPATMPALATDRRGCIYVAWEDRRHGARDIRFNRSTDAGRTWWPEDRRLDSDEAGAHASYHPQIAAWEDGTVLVCWWDERNGLADLYVRRSTDGGETWPQPEVRLDPGTAGVAASRGARLAVAGDHLVIVWEEFGPWERDEILACVSSDQGVSWGGKTPDWNGTHLAGPSGKRGRSPAAWFGRDGLGCLAWVSSCPARSLVCWKVWGDGIAKPGDRAMVGLAAPAEGAPWLGGAGGFLWLAWAHRPEPRGNRETTPAPIGVMELSGLGMWAGQRLTLRSPDQAWESWDGGVHSLTGAVAASGVLHLAWVGVEGQLSRIRAIRLEPTQETAGEADQRSDEPDADQRQQAEQDRNAKPQKQGQADEHQR